MSCFFPSIFFFLLSSSLPLIPSRVTVLEVSTYIKRLKNDIFVVSIGSMVCDFSRVGVAVIIIITTSHIFIRAKWKWETNKNDFWKKKPNENGYKREKKNKQKWCYKRVNDLCAMPLHCLLPIHRWPPPLIVRCVCVCVFWFEYFIFS